MSERLFGKYLQGSSHERGSSSSAAIREQQRLMELSLQRIMSPERESRSSNPAVREQERLMDKRIMDNARRAYPTSVGLFGGVGFSGVQKEGLLRYFDGKHAFGDFSMAVMQANVNIEDQSQVESGDFGTFVGIYDGHGGCQASEYALQTLYPRFRGICLGAGPDAGVNQENLGRVFLETDNGFTSNVDNIWNTVPEWAKAGTCSLVGIINGQKLHVANAGDSRAVLGRLDNNGGVTALQLSAEHSVALQEVRSELRQLYPREPLYSPIFAVNDRGRFKLKSSITQATRSIGDVYMKHVRFNAHPLDKSFRIAEPTHMPYITAYPAVDTYPLQREDSFVIFASRGLWELISNEVAVDVVHGNLHAGSARKLVQTALNVVAKRRGMSYSELMDTERVGRDVRSRYHGDISVVVLFLKWDLIETAGGEGRQKVSIRSARDNYY